MTHTPLMIPPLPWAVDDELPPNARDVFARVDGTVPISSSYIGPMPRRDSRGAAHLIVRAVNAHDELVAASAELLRVVREVLEPELGLYAKHYDDAHGWQNDAVNKAVDAAAAALAKAKE